MLNRLSYSLLACVEKRDSYPTWVTYHHLLVFHLHPLVLGVQVDPVIHSFRVNQVDLHITHTCTKKIVAISKFVYKPKDYLYFASMYQHCWKTETSVNMGSLNAISGTLNVWHLQAITKLCASAKSRFCDLAYCGFQCFITDLPTLVEVYLKALFPFLKINSVKLHM